MDTQIETEEGIATARALASCAGSAAKVEIPLRLLADLIDVCGWHQTMVNSLKAGETYENHPDQNAVDYLESEALRIQRDAIACLPPNVGDEPPRGAPDNDGDLPR